MATRRPKYPTQRNRKNSYYSSARKSTSFRTAKITRNPATRFAHLYFYSLTSGVVDQLGFYVDIVVDHLATQK